MILASLLFAYVISSPELGQFFELDSWVPTEVTATFTPGSSGYVGDRRITTNTIAAVNAVFEAFCERAYWSIAGESNSWSTATYGPLCRGTDKHEFLFSAQSDGLWYWRPDSGRELKTRRLIAYENLRSLAQRFLTDETINRRMGFYRPNWNSYYEVRWSSQAISASLPTILWADLDTFLPAVNNNWANVAPTWKNLSRGDSKLYLSTSGTDDIVYSAISGIGYSEPKMDELYLYVTNNYTLPTTYWNITGQDIEGVTNETRRLLVDRVTGLDCVLASLDRTYYQPAAVFPSLVTNRTASASREYQGEAYVNATLTFDGTSWSGTFPTTSMQLTQISSSHTNRAEASETASRYVRYMTSACHEFTTSAEASTSNYTYAIELQEAELRRYVGGLRLSEGDYCFAVFRSARFGSDGSAELIIITEDRYGKSTLAIPLDTPRFSSFLLTGFAQSRTSYSYGYTYNPNGRYARTICYPGRFERVGSAVLWAVDSCGAAEGTSDYHMTWNRAKYLSYDTFPSTFESWYQANLLGGYNSSTVFHGLKTAEMNAIASKCDAEFNSMIGNMVISDPVSVLDTVSAGLSEKSTLSNMEIRSGTLTVSVVSMVGVEPPLEGQIDLVYYEIDENGDPQPQFQNVYRNGQYVSESVSSEWTVAAFGITIDNVPTPKSEHEPTNHDFYGAAVNGQISIWSRVDWLWNALRRHY